MLTAIRRASSFVSRLDGVVDLRLRSCFESPCLVLMTGGDRAPEEASWCGAFMARRRERPGPLAWTSAELLPRSQLDAELAGTFWLAARPALFNAAFSVQGQTGMNADRHQLFEGPNVFLL